MKGTCEKCGGQIGDEMKHGSKTVLWSEMDELCALADHLMFDLGLDYEIIISGGDTVTIRW
jgi:hypothetical protein